MLKSSLVAAIGTALALTAFTAPPILAQTAQEQQAQQSTDLPSREVDDTAQGRSSRRSDSRIRRGNAQAAPATPEENIAAAQTIATAAGAACQVTQANLLGVTAERNSTYEAACATGPGYILISTTPPQAIDCVLLAGQAEIDRARDPAAEPGTQCIIPQNADILRVISAYATEAGIACTVDQGASIGKGGNGNLIYEVGCNDADGFWIEKEAAGWKKTECAIIATQNATCRYSTTAEAITTFKTRLVGSEAEPCDVTENRYMGSNANGSFWEAKCNAGNGVIVRFNADNVVQQVYACEVAHRIGGGCTLTIVPPAPAEAPAVPQ